MKIRHVIDESDMRLEGFSSEQVLEILGHFLERLDLARDRGEEIARTASDLYEAPVTSDLQLFQVLFDDDISPITDIDLRRRLRIAIDRASLWDDDDELVELVSDLDAEIDGALVFAPSVAFAHGCRVIPRVVGCLGFSRERAGLVEVSIGGRDQKIHFVVDEPTHVAVFRDAVEIEEMDEIAFAQNSGSAFPRLLWVDNVWSGIGHFERPYREHRQALVHHLGVLNDHAAELFAELMATRPNEVGARLDALGVEASDENGRTKQDRQARRDRTRRFRGQDQVFWWHTKLLRHVDRIHFLWQPGENTSCGDIVVGIFTDHCHLPD